MTSEQQLPEQAKIYMITSIFKIMHARSDYAGSSLKTTLQILSGNFSNTYLPNLLEYPTWLDLICELLRQAAKEEEGADREAQTAYASVINRFWLEKILTRTDSVLMSRIVTTFSTSASSMRLLVWALLPLPSAPFCTYAKEWGAWQGNK